MSSSKRQLTGRLLAEFAIIFVGVVLAFQFENWRESRQDQERAAEAIEALAADFEENIGRLESTLEAQEATVEAVLLWIRAAAGAEHGASTDSLAATWPYAVSWYAEEMVSGAWDALTSSGDVGLLADRDLRGRLSGFYGVANAGFEDHDNEMDLLMSLLLLSQEEAGELLAPEGELTVGELKTGVDPEIINSIQNDPRLHGLLAWKGLLSRNRMARLNWLLDEARDIESQLAQASEG